MHRQLATTIALALAAPLIALLPAGSGHAADEPTAVYTVAKHDTLIGLGRTVLVSSRAWPEVAQLNRLPDPNRIWPGQQLTVPLRLLRSTALAATISQAQGDVRANSQAVRAGDLLRQGDRLSTADASSAVLQLADGSRVLVAPDSEAELQEHRRYSLKNVGSAAGNGEGLFAASMRLARGSLELVASKVLRAKPLEVNTPTAVIGVRGTEYRVHHDSAQATRTEVLSGAVRADARAASGADVAGGFGAALREAAAPTVVQLAPAPDLSRLATRLDEPALRMEVTLKAPSAAPAAIRVQLAADAAFERLLQDTRLAPGDMLSLAGLADGSYHLRIRQIDALGIEGFNAQQTLTLGSGGPAAVIQAPGPRHPVGPVGFAWAPIEGAVRYQLQVARDAEFLQLVHDDAQLSQPRSRVLLAEPGPCYWRVARISASGQRGVWTAPLPLLIERPVRPAP